MNSFTGLLIFYFKCQLTKCTCSSLFRYDSEGKETSLASIGSGMSPSTKNGARSMYSDRVSLLHITSNPSLGEEKVKIVNPLRR